MFRVLSELQEKDRVPFNLCAYFMICYRECTFCIFAHKKLPIVMLLLFALYTKELIYKSKI